MYWKKCKSGEVLYTEAVRYILDIPKFTKKHSLDHTRELMKALGNPQETLKVIHVGGTNGKGSVCAMMDSILRAGGKRTGMFTSPHLVHMEERIRIDGREIEKEEFCRIFQQVKQVSCRMEQEGKGHPTFFEFLFAMGMLAFARAKAEYAVVEVGLGGRLDCTNIIKKPVCTILTNVSLEHTEILGNTIEQIAQEKAGIIKKGVPLFFFDENKIVSRIWSERAQAVGSRWYAVCEQNIKILNISQKKIDFSLHYGYYVYDSLTLPFIGSYQVKNGGLAVLAASFLENIKEQHIQEGLKNVVWHGRMECIEDGIYLDGAHNADGVRMFIRSVKERSSHVQGKCRLLFSAVMDKDYPAMIKQLCQEVDWDRIYITQVQGKRCLKTEELQACFEQYSDTAITVIKDVKDCYCQARKDKGRDDVLFCAGSLYLIGEICGMYHGSAGIRRL